MFMVKDKISAMQSDIEMVKGAIKHQNLLQEEQMTNQQEEVLSLRNEFAHLHASFESHVMGTQMLDANSI